MPRRKAAVKREVLPDPLFISEEVTKFINVIIRHGKKSIAEKIVYSALFMLHERMRKEGKADDGESGSAESGKSSASSESVVIEYQGNKFPRNDVLALLRKSLGNISPSVEVKSRRVGGATYQVPIEVPGPRGIALAMRWVVTAAKSRSEKTMAHRLSAELYDACLGRGTAVKKRDDIHRMAKANQAFAHYRW